MEILGHRLRIGVVIPSTNTSVQPEMDEMRPFGIANHISRMEIVDERLTEAPGFSSVIAALRRSTEPAIRSLRDCQVHRLIVAVSPDAYWSGIAAHGEVLRQLSDAANGIQITMSADAIEKALARIGDVLRIGLISPYTRIGDEAVCRFFVDKGYEVVALSHLEGQSPSKISSVSLSDLRRAVDLANDPRADAIVQVGTNVPMARFAHTAEQWTGKKVISNNTALYWHALRAAGIHDQLDGFGTLFSQY